MRDLERALKAPPTPPAPASLKLLGRPLCVCQVQALLGWPPHGLQAPGAPQGGRPCRGPQAGALDPLPARADPANGHARACWALLRGPSTATRRGRRPPRLREVRAVPLVELCRAPLPPRARAAVAGAPPAGRRRARRA